MNFEIFRAYDIRGIYPKDLDEDAYYRIAKGYVYNFKPEEIAVGMDARLSSPPLKESLVKGLLDAGVNVLDIGQITTDMLYFAVSAYNCSGGIIVSASHNPSAYNGLKMVREKSTAISSDTGLFDIRDAIKLNKDQGMPVETKGTYRTKEILDDYVEHVLGFIDTTAIKKFRFVGNANFGFVSKAVNKIIDRLGLTLVPLNFEPDGSFPKGPPDPMLQYNQVETRALVRESRVDFGVAWDGDADRVMFFDEDGSFVPGVYITALLADILLEKYGAGNKIIFDPRVIWPVIDAVKRKGGVPIMSKSGHAFMKDRMRSEDGLFAGELSAHYYFRDNFYADNGVIPFLLILEHLSRRGCTLRETLEPFMKGHHVSGELNYKVKSIQDIMDAVRSRFSSRGEEDATDGYSLEAKEWRFNIRASNTEPLLRLNIEGRSAEVVEELKTELEGMINQ